MIHSTIKSTERNDLDLGPTPYYAVSARKFITLSILTLGIYEIYWFYKNWKFVKAKEQSDIWPWARALFGVLWYPALLIRLGKPRIQIVFLGLVYLGISFLWRFPDPFWVLSILTFLPLLPAVSRIKELNATDLSEYREHSAWRPRHTILAALTGPLMAILLTSGVGILPSAQVQPGWMLWRHNAFMREVIGLVPGERVLYFYSAGFFSIKPDGNILTDRRVISYWEDPFLGGFYLDSVDLDDIREVEIAYGNWLSQTAVTVKRHDGSEVRLILSAESGGDRRFLDTLDDFVAAPMITVIPGTETRSWDGTCFAVRPDGYLLTSHHIVEGAIRIEVTFDGGDANQAEIAEVDSENDLALLRIRESTPAYLSLGEVDSLGERVFTIGFPVTGILGLEPKYTEGSVSSLAGAYGESNVLQISVPIQPGNSGGPLANELGQAVGVITSSAIVSAFMSTAGSLPQNINWAVKTVSAESLFEAPPELMAPDRTQAIEMVRRAVCYVEAFAE